MILEGANDYSSMFSNEFPTLKRGEYTNYIWSNRDISFKCISDEEKRMQAFCTLLSVPFLIQMIT